MLASPSNAKRRQCIANLRALEGSKVAWAIQLGKTTNDAPADAELFGPMGYVPICPRGGSYTIGKVGEAPTCSLADHRIGR